MILNFLEITGIVLSIAATVYLAKAASKFYGGIIGSAMMRIIASVATTGLAFAVTVFEPKLPVASAEDLHNILMILSMLFILNAAFKLRAFR